MTTPDQTEAAIPAPMPASAVPVHARNGMPAVARVGLVLALILALLAVALSAAFVAALKPSDILPLVSASFSIAASAFVPAMVLGIFWRRATRIGAVAGMVGGLLLTVGYLVAFTPHTRDAWPILKALQPWWGIQPVAAGVFGVPFGAFVLVVVSLLTQHTSAHEIRRDSLPI